VSIDAFVFTRTEPDLELGDQQVVTIEYVQILPPRPVQPDDWRRIGRAPDPTMKWLIDVNCSNTAWVKLDMFAQAVARRCGGGLWWCDLTGQINEVPSRPDPGTWSLRRAAEVAQEQEADWDEAEWDDPELTGAPAGDYAFTVGPAGQFTVHGSVSMRDSELEWEIGIAKRGSADGWTGASESGVQVFALLEGHGDNQVNKYCLGTMRRALDYMREHKTTNPITPGYAAESPAAWVQRTHDHAVATTFKKPLFRRRPQGWGTLSIVRAEGTQLRLAHAGDSRAYLLGPRGVETLIPERQPPPQQVQPASAIGTEAMTPEERNVTLEPDDAIILISFQVYTSLGARFDEVMLEALGSESAQAAADFIVSNATATCGAVIVAFYGG
jgi:serine/threonine protein phosphatase PrpC